MKARKFFTILFVVIFLIAIFFLLGISLNVLVKSSMATVPPLEEAGKYSVLGAILIYTGVLNELRGEIK